MIFRTLFLFSSALALCCAALVAFGEPALAPGMPADLGGKVVQDYIALPAHVQNLRILEDGTWVVATHRDPKQRRGIVNAKPESGPKLRWIASDELVKATGVEAAPVHIDASGAGWFRTLDPVERHAWIVSDGTNIHQVLATTKAGATSVTNLPLGALPESPRARFRGVPWETRNGDLWFLSTTGVHRWRHGTTSAESAAKRLDHYPVHLGENLPEQGEEVWPKTSLWSARHAIREGLGGQVLIARGSRDTTYDGSLENLLEGEDPPQRPVWLHAPGWNGLARSALPMPSTNHQIFPDPNGFWILSRPERTQLETWAPDAQEIPPELTALILKLGAPSFRERESASRQIHREFGTAKGHLRAFQEVAGDPEVRQRLSDLIHGFDSENDIENVLKDEDSDLRSFPLVHRLAVPRSLDRSRTYLALNWKAPAEDDPRPGRWAVFAFGLDGSVEEIAADLPGHWAPSPALDCEQVSAFDLARIDERTVAWRDALGGLCIIRDGKRVRLTPPPGGPARFPLPQCRILSSWSGGLIVRLHRQVLVITAETIRNAPVDDIPPPSKLSKELRAHTARFVQEYKDYYNSDLEAEDLLKLVDRVLAEAPSYPRGLYAQGEFRYSVSGEDGSRIALRASSQALGLARHTGDRILERSSIWAELDFHLEAVRDMNQAIEVEQRFPRGSLSSQLLVRGNHFLEAQRWEASLRDFRRTIALNPDNQVARNNIAWVLAGAADPAFRDGKEAVRLATIVCEAEDYEASYSVDTLAAAYAEIGDFEKAIEMQEKAIDLIDQNDEKQRWAEFQAHLKLFKMKKPVRLPEPSIDVEPEEDAEDERGL